MYHRGNQATGRDLFDLAMVIECEPGALANAEHFIYRYLDTLTANLQASSAYYMREFEAIQTLNYYPTFTHAAKVVSEYLMGLIQTYRLSAKDVAEFALHHGLTVLSL